MGFSWRTLLGFVSQNEHLDLKMRPMLLIIHWHVHLDLQIRLAGRLICSRVLLYKGLNTHINVHAAF